MKFIKFSFLALFLAGSLASCLKPKNDFGGMRTDEGKPVISIAEKQYQETDLHVLGGGYNGTFANFSFATANESVRFFTLHVSQPRDNKLPGGTVVTFTTSPADIDPAWAIYAPDPIPAGAIDVKSVTIPASSDTYINVPVYFTVNKALLDPSKFYGVRFTIATATNGVINALGKTIDVLINPQGINNSIYNGRYIGQTTIVDSAKVYGITLNTRPIVITEGRYDPVPLASAGNQAEPGILYVTDAIEYAQWRTQSFNMYVHNLTNGASTVLMAYPVYKVDATGKIIDVMTRATPHVSLNPIFDPSSPNKITVTKNDMKQLDAKYSIRLTAASLNRPFTVTEHFVYQTDNQVYY